MSSHQSTDDDVAYQALDRMISALDRDALAAFRRMLDSELFLRGMREAIDDRLSDLDAGSAEG